MRGRLLAALFVATATACAPSEEAARVHAGDPSPSARGDSGLESGTVAYLPLNEGSGTLAGDVVSGSTYPVGKLTWTAGRFGQALSLPGPLAELALGERRLGDEYTVSLWVRPRKENLGTKRRILNAPGRFTLYMTQDGAARVEFYTDPSLQMISDPLRLGEWNHIAVVQDAAEFHQVRLVANGSYRNKPAETYLPEPDDWTLVVGGKGYGVPGLLGAVDDVRIRDRATSTAVLLERFTGQPTIAPIAKPVLETAADWENGDLRHVAYVDGALERVPGHWERIEAADPPLARTTHLSAYVGAGRVFLFGGETRDTHGWVWANTNDTWLFHTREGRWERIETEKAPGPRCHQPAAYSPDHGFVLLMGGYRNDEEGPFRYSDTWRFYPDEGRWERRKPGGQKMPALANCGLVYHPVLRRFLLFINDKARVAVYDPDADEWEVRPAFEAVNEAGEAVDYVVGGSPMVGYDPVRDAIVVFGGGRNHEDGTLEFVDTTAVYDAETNRFTVLDVDQSPAPRVRSGFAYDPKRERFVLFGGVREQSSDRMADLWVFDPAEPRWTQIAASNGPSARGGYYGMSHDPELDRFFLLCGRHSKERFLDEAWSLAFLDEGAEAGAAATYVFDRDAFPGKTQWSAETRGNVAFRFRVGDDLSTWSDWADSPAIQGRYLQVEIRLLPGEEGQEARVSRLGFR